MAQSQIKVPALPAAVKYKVVYTKGTTEMFYEKLFDTINDATTFGHGLKDQWLLLSQAASAGSDASWKLLPYGGHKAYQNALSVYRMRTFIMVAAIALLGFAISRMFK